MSPNIEKVATTLIFSSDFAVPVKTININVLAIKRLVILVMCLNFFMVTLVIKVIF